MGGILQHLSSGISSQLRDFLLNQMEQEMLVPL